MTARHRLQLTVDLVIFFLTNSAIAHKDTKKGVLVGRPLGTRKMIW